MNSVVSLLLFFLPAVLSSEVSVKDPLYFLLQVSPRHLRKGPAIVESSLRLQLEACKLATAKPLS